MLTLLFSKMAELPVGYRHRLRELTIGPVAWGLWSLTLHDGSTWALLAIVDEQIVGWACVTKEYDLVPVIGAYVAKEARKQGIGATLVTTLLRHLIGLQELRRGDVIAATTSRWPRYSELVASVGLVCQEWA